MNKYKDIIEGLDSSVKMVLDKVRRYLSANKASVMVGCGFSLNAENDGTGQMREWNALNLDLFRSLYSREPEAGELDNLNPVRLAAQVESVHGEHELDEIIMNALPDKSVYPGALHKKLMKLHWRDVFTTNYDTLLERSCDESGSAYTLVTTKETLQYSKSPRIIKLHGSFPNVRPFIMSEEQFRTYPQKYPEFVNTVRQSLIENLFCLIGFSGNDPNFLSWLGWIRDVMGEQMTNAILVDYKSKGMHVSERQLFSSRKIDILNLADINGLETYKDALDFFMTYISMKEKEMKWDYPNVSIPRKFREKTEPDFSERIKNMAAARTSSPGWLFMPEKYVATCGINEFPFMDSCYKEMDEDLKLPFLYELDWLLDVSLYPKNAEWYLDALNQVKDKFETYKGCNREMARQLIVSLMCIYREKRMLDEYLATSDFVKTRFFDELTTKQLTVFYYEQCLWNLSQLDYKSVYAILLKWHVQENDFLSALWQAAVYAELGDQQIAEDMLLLYHSRLTTRMLSENKSEYLTSCMRMYAHVMSRLISRNRFDVELSDDNSIDNLKRKYVDAALKEQPKQSQSHGFNIGQVTNHSHSYQSGYVADYLNSSRYLRLTYLHGSTFRPETSYDVDGYGKILEITAKYHMYQAIALLVRCGKESLLEKVATREQLSKVDKNDVSVMFTELFEMMRENVEETNRRKKNIAFSILVPILQRLCCKAGDEDIEELFDFIMSHLNDSRIKRNEILKTIYNCATSEQKEKMFKQVMNHPIVRDDRWNDILWPSCKIEIELHDEVITDLVTSLKNRDLKKLAYSRILELLACTLKADQKTTLEKAIVDWRKKERKDVNAFFSYHVVEAQEQEDIDVEKWWVKSVLENFLSGDYSYNGSSESIMNFVHSADSVVPAIYKLSDEDLAKVVQKIHDTLTNYLPILKKDDSDQLFGGMRHFSSIMFDELERVFGEINFGKTQTELRSQLLSVLMEYFEAKHPCFYLICIIDNATEGKQLALTAHNKLFSKSQAERLDGMRSVFYMLRNRKEEIAGAFMYVWKLNYFIQYSQSKYMSEYLKFLAEIVSNDLVDVDEMKGFNDALQVLNNDLLDYDMPFEFKMDIAYNACILSGILSAKSDDGVGVSAWQSFAKDSEQFRDVCDGWNKGVMMASTN